jgi:hypothetical protein
MQKPGYERNSREKCEGLASEPSPTRRLVNALKAREGIRRPSPKFTKLPNRGDPRHLEVQVDRERRFLPQPSGIERFQPRSNRTRHRLAWVTPSRTGRMVTSAR